MSVWVVGCTLSATQSAPTNAPTNTPPITLTVRVLQPRPPTHTPQHTTSSRIQGASTPQAARSYVVRPGDTLLGIALDFGVEVEQLQASNPEIDPLQLQVGQAIVIPFSRYANVTPSTFSPVELSLPQPTCYGLPTNTVYCLGQVVNPQTFPVEQVRVSVQIMREGIITERTASVERSIVWPGQSAPYSVRFPGEWDEGDTALAILQTAKAVDDDNRYVRLAVEDQQVEQRIGRYQVAFTLHNLSDTATYPVNIILMLLDTDGSMIGYRTTQTGLGVAPNARLSTQIEVISHVQNTIARHVLYVEARRAG
jgi:LysM repeat protein